MSRVCEEWPLEDLADMEDKDVEKLLGFYGPNEVPSLSQIRGETHRLFTFDGSFGWM
jgi:precorrin-2 dehydrogenase / sirohydrochlorin ferrochelatase